VVRLCYKSPVGLFSCIRHGTGQLEVEVCIVHLFLVNLLEWFQSQFLARGFLLLFHKVSELVLRQTLALLHFFARSTPTFICIEVGSWVEIWRVYGSPVPCLESFEDLVLILLHLLNWCRSVQSWINWILTASILVEVANTGCLLCVEVHLFALILWPGSGWLHPRCLDFELRQLI